MLLLLLLFLALAAAVACWCRWHMRKIDECREQQDHPAPFVHDGRPAARAAQLARQVMRGAAGAGVVKLYICGAVLKEYIRLMEDCGPLEGRTCRVFAP